MRVAEWINVIYFLFLIAMAWLRQPAPRQRAKVTFSATTALVLVTGAFYSQRVFSPLLTSVIRDWLPVAILLMAYWTAGLFYAHPNERFQSRLLQIDRKISVFFERNGGHLLPLRWIAGYFELAYLLCYPLVPFGLGVLYVARMGRCADAFWTMVLPSAYLCYGTLPFLQTLPPRILETGGSPIFPSTWIRKANLWILGWGSIQINTFPSAHAATAFAVSFALLQLLPSAGIFFLWISISIAIGAVLGRYHYAADAAAGVAIAAGVALVEILI